MARIHDSLRGVLARHRLVFWYDPEKQWTQTLEGFEEPGVNIIRVADNEFAIKVAIHRDRTPGACYLLYFASARPNDVDNWLLDLLLQGHEYKADRASLALQEAGIRYEFLPIVEEHVTFFESDKRASVLRERLTAADDAMSLRRKMMGILAGTEPDVDDILLGLLVKSAPDPGAAVLLELDPVQTCLGASGLDVHFWKLVASAFAYASESPTLTDFVTVLFRGANPLDPNVSLSPHGRVFLQRWKDSQTCCGAYRLWSERMEADLHVVGALTGLDDARAVGDSDVFATFEKFVLHGLVRAFVANAPSADLLATIEARRMSFWFPAHADGYEAISHAIAFRNAMSALELKIDSIDVGVSRYVNTWHRVDTAYRKFCFYVRRYGQVALMEGVTELVGKTYVNGFLLPLADAWGDQVRPLAKWDSEVHPCQTSFFGTYVQAYLSKKQKVVVVVSDALRFEAAAEFAVQLRMENRWTAELTATLGSLPSYTQLGMAALLPGRERELTLEDGYVTVDGCSASGVNGRSNVLKAALGNSAAAVQAEAFLEMNTKTEARALLSDHDVVYIFHNTIDKIGDSAATEAKTAEAVETAFEELKQILKKVANANVTHMLLTADHGFLFQQSDVLDADDLALPAANEWFFKNRRFALGRGIEPNPSVKVFPAAAIGLSGDWSAAFPLALGRFPLKGSGKRFVHGGLSLQEIVVPVVTIHKTRADDTMRVEVDLLRVPSKLTTGQASLSLYQAQPVAEKVLPRTLRIGVFSLDGVALSEVRTMVFDSADTEPRQREKVLGLTLSRAADAYNNQEVEIRLEELIPGTSQSAVYKSHRVKLHKPFESDFDE